MHNAPPVDYPVGRFFWGMRLSGLLAAVAAVGLLVWQFQSERSGALGGVAACAWILSVVLAMRFANREFLVDGFLVWDGQAWFWRDLQRQEHPVHVQVLVDTGRALFVACQVRNGSVGVGTDPQFAWLQQAAMPLSWHGFRCAVYSRPMDETRPDGRFGS
jgi:hypothetical protein